MARVEVTPQARSDIAEIWSYVARDNPAAADRLIRQIDDGIHLIGDNPRSEFARTRSATACAASPSNVGT